MKKLIFGILLFLSCFNIVYAYDKKEIILDKCVDGDTAWFYLNNEKIKVRFLAIDTPESTNKIEEYGKEASKFTCNELTNANKIELEYDENSDEIDKYNRKLGWIFVDGELLQKKIIENGLGEIKYVYGDYKYIDILKESENKAKINKIGIWNKNDTNEINYYILIIIVIGILFYIFNKSSRKKINTKLKKKIKHEITKKMDDLF